MANGKNKPTYSGTDVEIEKYWKDENYRNSLTEEQRAKLPKNPAGEVELPDEELRKVARMPMKTWSECYSLRTDYTGCSCPGTG